MDGYVTHYASDYAQEQGGATAVYDKLQEREQEILAAIERVLANFGTSPWSWEQSGLEPPLPLYAGMYATNRQTQAEEIERMATAWGSAS